MPPVSGAARDGTLARMPSSGQAPADVDAAEIAAAVAAESAFMEDVLCRLVEAPTTLGNEEPGQEVMRDAFREIGLEPVDMPLDEEMLRTHPGRLAVLVGRVRQAERRRRLAAGRRGRPLARAERPHRRRRPAAESLWRTAPFTAVRDGDWLYGRGAGDMKGGLAVILGAVKALQRSRPRTRSRPCSCSRSSRRSAPATERCSARSAASAPTRAS